MGSKSVTTKSMSESSQEIFLKKIRIRKTKTSYFKMVITLQAPLNGSFNPQTDYSRASKQHNHGSFDSSSREMGKPHPNPPMASQTNRSNSPLGELDAPYPTRPTASCMNHFQLAQQRVVSTKSKSPNDELDQSCSNPPSSSKISPAPRILVSGTPSSGSR